MKTLEIYEIKELSYYELLAVSGGDPFTHDLGYVIGKVVGWFKNSVAENSASDNTWMLEVPPLTLFS